MTSYTNENIIISNNKMLVHLRKDKITPAYIKAASNYNLKAIYSRGCIGGGFKVNENENFII